MNQSNHNKSKEKAKYQTIRGLASKTLKNVSRAAGIKTKNSRKHSSKILFPNVMPNVHEQGHRHRGLSFVEDQEDNHDEPAPDLRTSTLASIVHSTTSMSTSTSKTLERMMDRSYYKDWVRLGLIAPEYNLAITKGQTYASSMQNESFRVTTVNYRYALAINYPSILLVPAK